MRRLITLTVLLLASNIALADQWVPYTDGRLGGCWTHAPGKFHGCTLQKTNNQISQQVSARNEACANAQQASQSLNGTADIIQVANAAGTQSKCDDKLIVTK